MKFDLTNEEAQLMVQAIAKLPIEVGFNLYIKLQKQAADQLNPPTPEQAPAAPEKKTRQRKAPAPIDLSQGQAEG